MPARTIPRGRLAVSCRESGWERIREIALRRGRGAIARLRPSVELVPGETLRGMARQGREAEILALPIEVFSEERGPPAGREPTRGPCRRRPVAC